VKRLAEGVEDRAAGREGVALVVVEALGAEQGDELALTSDTRLGAGLVGNA
jgi:hypothetical protein